MKQMEYRSALANVDRAGFSVRLALPADQRVYEKINQELSTSK
ncbi:MAG: hypothetical protein U0805_20865 [Pirellulales bacterium]